MKKTTVYTLVSVLAVLATGAASADGGGDKMEMFTKADKNADGVVTHAEMMASVQMKFAEFDKNKDGSIVLSELPEKMPVPEGMEKRLAEKKAKLEKEGKEISEEKLKKWEERRPTRVQFLARMDDNKDEKISLTEFAEPLVRHFKRADINGDGSITKAEAEEAGKHRGKDHHGKKGDMRKGDMEHSMKGSRR
ncbi:EF-hand domain-containing protein [Kordiimonas pumila]|uniref:EF-hand domain-containing protein n=1 Tax=Kordiimonas pumila TaxID=2161677 RepID=A0ABV7D0S1_9PROT|nr:EF-hand domain-containing protein [Kordiimonas pumila]